MKRSDEAKWFRAETDRRGGTTTVQLRLANSELDRLVRILLDEKRMEPVCAAMRGSDLERALGASTYCARCRNQFGEIYESHEFRAKNWVSAFAKALWYCKGSFQMVKGACGTAYGRVIKH